MFFVVYFFEKLTPDHSRDLNRQERLTNALLGCKPNLRSVSAPIGETQADAVLALISTELELPIHLASYGPTAVDKRALAFV